MRASFVFKVLHNKAKEVNTTVRGITFFLLRTVHALFSSNLYFDYVRKSFLFHCIYFSSFLKAQKGDDSICTYMWRRKIKFQTKMSLGNCLRNFLVDSFISFIFSFFNEPFIADDDAIKPSIDQTSDIEENLRPSFCETAREWVWPTFKSTAQSSG